MVESKKYYNEISKYTNEVYPRLFKSGIKVAVDQEVIETLGITHIVNVVAKWEYPD